MKLWSSLTKKSKAKLKKQGWIPSAYNASRKSSSWRATAKRLDQPQNAKTFLNISELVKHKPRKSVHHYKKGPSKTVYEYHVDAERLNDNSFLETYLNSLHRKYPDGILTIEIPSILAEGINRGSSFLVFGNVPQQVIDRLESLRGKYNFRVDPDDYDDEEEFKALPKIIIRVTV